MLHEGTFINPKNAMIEEIKSRIAAGNRCFCSLGQICSSRAVDEAFEIKIYQMIVKAVVVYGSAKWAVSEIGTNRLGTWERRIQRRMYGLVVEQGI